MAGLAYFLSGAAPARLPRLRDCVGIQGVFNNRRDPRHGQARPGQAGLSSKSAIPFDKFTNMSIIRTHEHDI